MNALIIMTRIPVAGKTKTRLMKILTGEQCASIHKSFLMDILNTTNFMKKNMDIYLTYSDEGPFSIIESLIPEYIKAFPQSGKILGEKMRNAIENLLDNGYDKVVLIGSDIPEVQPNNIEKAFEILDEKDVCFGPTMDGGYYLVGMKKMHPIVFESDIKWGSKYVFDNTMGILNKANLQVGFVDKYEDIDTEEDLKKLINRINNKNYTVEPERTKDFLNNWWRKVYVERYTK
ncbi:TIGR04282 family arsenosugar biosynthesis glycosyltransferase [Clostridium niameyense]|uniref:TIGR04282 family arsenosugar biosynthesis glycosyltransferase n=1 Tax=Clostridium niameyense TaxID=1622073 RepID=UPI00067E9CF2|nr:TIGR04282 family arsenosugar biosynthesis glycosyltransferase [Clostridium niameyense]